MHVLINGGGIGGLTLAAALRDRPLDTTVLERSAVLRAAGAGIVIAPNARHALRTIGIDLTAVGRPFRTFVLADGAGGRLGGTPPIPGPEPGVTIHRQALLEAIAAMVPDPVHLEREVTAWSPPVATVSDGSTISPDVLVGADGIGSAVRGFAFHPADEPVPAGYRCWRTVVSAPPSTPDEPTEYWGVGLRAGLVPLPGSRVYVYLCANESAEPDLGQRFSGFARPVREAIAAASHWHVADIAEHMEHRWVSGRAVCLGDASHALTPNLGQGAAMAIEDAVTLASALEATDVDRALASWAARRARRVDWVARASRRIGAVGQWSSPWACSLRNLAVRVTPALLTRSTGRRLAAWRAGTPTVPRPRPAETPG